MASTLIGKQAVVIGAGMGGLAAAGALAEHFEQVVVLERDALPSEPTHRSGMPQARHVHALLLSGQRALGALFPDFEQDLARAGAVRLNAGLDPRLESPGLQSIPATRSRLLRIRGVAARHRARRAASGRRPREHRAAPALPGHGSAGVAKWRGGHRRALRERQRRERDDRGGSCRRRLRTRRAHSRPAAIDRPTAAGGNHNRQSISRLRHMRLSPSPTTPRPTGKAS